MSDRISEVDATAPRLPIVDVSSSIEEQETVHVVVARPPASQLPALPSQKAALPSQKTLADVRLASVFQERSRQLGLSIFFGEETKISSLGVTSSIAGEGKSFMTITLANILAESIENPVTVLECNWEHPSLHEYFNFSPTPGLAEWLRGECDERAISHRVSANLTIIPAGKGLHDEVKLLQLLKKNKVTDSFLHRDGLLLVDLPPVITSAYGALAASMVDSVILVIHAGVTTNLMVAETLNQLKAVPVHGIVLNQMKSRIPRWIRRLL